MSLIDRIKIEISLCAAEKAEQSKFSENQRKVKLARGITA
jgi:hypothetical protein